MDKPPQPPKSFVSRNLVTIVMVPVIIAAHFGWNAMQNNRSLVSVEEQIDLPIVTFGKFVWKKISGSENSYKQNVTATKAENP